MARTLPPCFTADDLVGVAEIALVRIADRWDDSLGIPFRGYAGRRIAGACRDIARRRYLAEAMAEAVQDAYQDPRPTAEDAMLAREQHRLVLKPLVSALPEHLQQIIRLHYDKGLSLTEVAREVGLSPAKASQLHQSALVALREIARQ